MKTFIEKIKEVFFSIFPIVIIVTLLNFFFVKMNSSVYLRFLISSVLMIFGLAIFLLSIENGVQSLGNLIGHSIANTGNLYVVILSGLVLGFMISVAEPDLNILGSQVQKVTMSIFSARTLVLVVSCGVAVLVSYGLLRILYNFSQRISFLLSYAIIFLLAFFANDAFVSIAFDSSGATTGAITVPFILALAYSISGMKKDSLKSEDDSFGLVGLASVGAILPVLILNIIKPVKNIGSGTEEVKNITANSILQPFFVNTTHVIKEVIISLLPLFILFIVMNALVFKLKKREFNKIFMGFVLTLIGLFFFLLGVNSSFLEVGILVGESLASYGNNTLILLTGFFTGLVVILAEPAVYVLTSQIEDVTGGHIKRHLVLIFLSLGISLAVMLSFMRIIIPQFTIYHILIPGYLIAIILSFIVDELYVGIAFDAGGVASGPMCATFILSLAQGIASKTPGADVLIDGFGVIAVVALSPILSLQILGLIYKIKERKSLERSE